MARKKIGVARDDTSRTSSGEFLIKAIASIPTATCISRVTDGRVVDVNDAFLRMTEYKRDEVIGRTPVELGLYANPDDRDTIIKALREEQPNDGLEARVRRKSGQSAWVLVSVSSLEVNEEQYLVTYAQDITARKEAEEKLERTRAQLQGTLLGTSSAIARMIQARDPYTAGHEERVGRLAVAIAQEMGLLGDRIEGIKLTAAVHDVGKIYVPAEILAKPGKLTDIEFALVKTHPQVGYEILSGIEFPWPVADIVWQHHEALDGSGYPRGLKGEQILLEARILTIADVVEAMASHRPYRPGLGVDGSLLQIVRDKGIKYDAQAVDACVRLFKENGFTLADS